MKCNSSWASVPLALVVSLICASAWADQEGSSPYAFARGSDGPLKKPVCVKIAEGDDPFERALTKAADDLCGVIDEAWRRHPQQQFDRALNVLKIDFQHDQATCAKDEKDTDSPYMRADELARLISEPNLLPPHYSGGLVLQNVKLAGPLALYSATVETPIAIVGATFCGGTVYRMRTLGLSDIDNTAIYLNAVHFKKRFIVSGSTVAGRILITNSRFEDSLGFVEVKGNTDEKDILRIASSLINPGLVLIGGRYTRGVDIRSNTIGSVLIFSPKFAGGFQLRDNDIEKAWIYNAVFEGETSISENHVKGTLRLWRVKFRPTNEPGAAIQDSNEQPEPPEITGNRIDGGFFSQLRRSGPKSFAWVTTGSRTTVKFGFWTSGLGVSTWPT